MNICEQLALIAQSAHDEFQTFIMYVALYSVIGFGVFFAVRWLLKCAKEYVDRMGRGGRFAQIAGLCATVALILYGGTKPEVTHLWRFTFANGIADNGSYCTNNLAVAKWTVNNQLILDGYALKAQYRNVTVTNEVGVCVDPWHDLTGGALADLQHTWEIPDATNCAITVWAEWVAPVVVHTNGVYHLNGVGREMGGTQKYVTPGIQILMNLETGECEIITPTNAPPFSAMTLTHENEQED